MKSSVRTGIALAFATASISGISIYLNKFAVQVLSDAVLFTTLKNTLVGLALGGYLLVTVRREQSFNLSPGRWLALVGLALVGGSVPFLLFFQGLALASAPSAALIHKSLFLWVALLAALLLRERLNAWALVGLGLLALGQLLVGWPRAWGWGNGESLILLATLLWAGETILARRLLPDVPTALAAAARMAGGALAMWLYLLGTRGAGGLPTLSPFQWGWVGLTSVFLLGYVTTWYAALKRAPATTVTSVLTLGAVITAGLNLVVEGQGMRAAPLVGLTLMVASLALILGLSRHAGPRVHAPAT
jgi:drug/metabolite transporter (DMT)-like permease